MIIIQPEGGLCNRMRAVCSALELAKRKHTKLIILWYCNEDLNAPFELLFKPIKGIKVINYSSSKDFRRLFLRKISRMKMDDKDIIANRVNGELDKVYVENIKLPLYICTFAQFYNIEEQFKIFQPAKPIKEKIGMVLKKYSTYTVGVHIRRTDQEKSIEYSKTENFIDLMKKEFLKNSNVKFYLATDDFEEEKNIRKEFPKSIISNSNRNLSRDSREGMLDAVIDLYCLSNCQKIIGSYWSSFTDVAAAINGLEKLIAGIDN